MLPLQFNPASPDGFYVTRLFGNDAGYIEAGGLEGSAGCYVPRLNHVLVPLSSLGLKRVGSRYSLEGRGENHTLIHEITHQLLSGWDLFMDMEHSAWKRGGMSLTFSRQSVSGVRESQ